MNKITFLLFLVMICHFAFSQQLPREIFQGQIVADTLGIENVTVFNSNTNKTATSDNLGYFTIYAREKDTLIFSNMAFQSKKMALTNGDFKLKVMRIKLDVYINNLDEVVISPYSLTGDLENDEKNIKIPEMPTTDLKSALETNFEADNQSTVQNTLMPGYLNGTYMVDLAAIGKKLIKLFITPKDKKEVVFVSDKIFQEAVKQRFSDDFFKVTLQLKKEEIGLFLSFCENDSKARTLLGPKKEFELIDFLIEKSKQYQHTQKE